MTRSSVGFGVDGRPCLWAMEQSGSGGGVLADVKTACGMCS